MKRVLSILAVLVMLTFMLPVATGQVSGSSGPQAICVPWQPTNAAIPHYTYSGKSVTLKAIARGTCTQFMWDYGDGSPAMAWTAIANSYDLGVTHTYTGVVGQSFIATVYVTDGTDTVSDTYPITIFDASDPSISSQLDVQVNIAIDEGLWWLHKNLQRYTFSAGAPGYGQPSGYWIESSQGGYTSAATGAAINAFQMHGNRVNGDYDGDPYVEDVQRAMNYLLYYTNTVAIGPETGKSTPDINGNGFGLYTSQHGWGEQTYVGGICGVALASCGAPNYTAPVGSGDVYGRKMIDIVQDEVEFFAWGQVDSGWGRGGWRYSADSGDADMSTTQWPILVMQAALENMGSSVPDWVYTELDYFLDYCEVTALNTNNGGYFYYPTWYLNLTKAGAGMICREFQGYTVADATVQRTLGFIYRHWNDNGGDWDWTKLFGNSYGMYAIMKSMRIPEPDITQVVEYDYSAPGQTANSFDWYYTPAGQANMGMATYIVADQYADGHWSDSVGYNAVSWAFATGWRILCLLKGVAIIPPAAVIYPCPVVGPPTPIYTTVIYALNQPVKLTGSESYSPDPSKAIVSYEWDLDNDGSFDDGTDVTALIAAGFTLAGDYTVGLRVTDNNPGALGGPQTGTDYYIIKVRPPDLNPVAVAGGPYLGSINIALQLDGSASWDADGLNTNPTLNIVSYEWDLDNDGLFDDATGAQPWVTWDAPFVGTIAIKVTDDGWHSVGGPTLGWTGWDIATASVEIGHHDPVSDPNGPYDAKANHTITLDGSGSYSPDSLAFDYSWDLNNDGTFGDDTTAYPAFATGAVPVGTVFNVALKVTDTYGGYDIEHTFITVVANQPPTANAGPDQTVEQTSAAGANVVLNGSGSTDADGDPLTYDWTWAGGGSATGVILIVSLPPGTTTLTLTVYDDDLASDTDTVDILIQDTGSPTVFPPADITTEATGSLTAVDIGTATATDMVDGDVSSSLTNDAPAAGYPLGLTTVTWTATDSIGNVGTATQKVTVVDTTAPVVTPPADVTVYVAEVPAAVSIGTATATDAIGVVSFSNNAPALFPNGATAVIWKAMDAAGNEGTSATSQMIYVNEVLHTDETNVELTSFNDPGITDVWVEALPVPGGAPPGFTPVEAYLVNSSGTGTFTLSFEVSDPANSLVYKIDPNPPHAWLLVPVTVVGNTVFITMTPGDPTFVFGHPLSGPVVGPQTGPQIWQLDSETTTPGYQMERTGSAGDDGQSGSVPIASGGTMTWLSDEPSGGITFTGGAWVLELATEADWGTDGSLCSFAVGTWNGAAFSAFTTYQLVTTSWTSGNEYILQVRVDTATESIPAGEYLAVQVTNSDASGHTIYTAENNEASCLRSPQSLPGYPLPEIASGIALAAGLLGIGGFILIRRKHALVKAL